MKQRTVFLASVATASIILFGFASGARLDVNAATLDTLAGVKCTNATVSVKGGAHSGPNYTALEITDLPLACAGLSVEFVIYNAAHAVLASGAGIAYSGGTPGVPSPQQFTTNVAFTDTAVLGVALLAATWGVATSYTHATLAGPPVTCVPYNNGGSPQPSKTCSVTISYDSGSPYPDGNGGLMTGFQIVVTSTAQSWRATIDFTNAAFPFNPAWLGQNSQTVTVVGACTNPLGTVTLRPANGATWGGYFNYGDTAPPPWWGATTLCP